MKERDEKLSEIENTLISAVRECRRKSERLMLFNQKRMLENSIEKYTHKKLLLIKYLDSLETAHSDSVILEVLSIKLKNTRLGQQGLGKLT